MRTTIRIDDALYRAVKERAAQRGRTMSNVIEDAVRRSLAESTRQSEDALPPLPTQAEAASLPAWT